MVATYAEIDIASFIDHTLLNPVTTQEQVDQWCAEAERFGFPTVCVYPAHVPRAIDRLHQKRPQVSTVIGFPSGATTSIVKQYEAAEAAELGVTELDVMINHGWLKVGKLDEVHQELAAIVETTGQQVKAILETHLLTDDEKRLAAEVCMDAGATFLQTNTGWYGAVQVEDVRLLKSIVKDRIGIKAAGGILSLPQAIELILAGATRLGTSKGPSMLRQRDSRERDTLEGVDQHES